MELVTWIIILISWVILIGSCYFYIQLWLLQNFEVKSTLVKVIFCLTFSLSGSMLELLLLELMVESINYALWQYHFILLAIIQIFITPGYILLLLFGSYKLLFLIFFLFYLYVLQLTYTMLIFTSVSLQINILGVFGILLSAVLSGFGAINCTYNYFNFFSTEATQANIGNLVHLSKRNIESLVQSRSDLLRIPPPKAKSMLKKTLNFFLQNEDANEIDRERVTNQIHALEAINQQYLKNIKEVLMHRSKEQIRSTFKGKVYAVFARVLVVYAVYKALFSIYNFILRRTYSVDPVTKSLLIICGILNVETDYVMIFTNQLSFIFIGVLIFTNMRSFANLLVSTINAFGKLITKGLSSDLVLLIFAEVMGAYFFATVIMMRANLPEHSRQSMSNAMAGIDFFNLHHIFDVTFAICSIIVSLVLYIKYYFSIKRKKL